MWLIKSKDMLLERLKPKGNSKHIGEQYVLIAT